MNVRILPGVHGLYSVYLDSVPLTQENGNTTRVLQFSLEEAKAVVARLEAKDGSNVEVTMPKKPKRLTTSEAADYIGCTIQHVRWLIRNKKIRARKETTGNNQWGYEYQITVAEAKRARDNRHKKHPNKGRPRIKEASNGS